ncbi:aldehyde dehydrogenase [Mycobacterium kansasii]|uniref:Aldehyde dehydrogenase n=1 Tax=Mycobacterium kansasii TaxID=1768 RepID=A0A7G1I2N5_MYCKA|nr:aldehyde dehydrogenase [Mycobacterium kansasii]
MALLADGVSALFIDGKLSEGNAGTFPTVNPATEEVLGVAADADAQDLGRAIEAARRAFDDTDWSRNIELRVRCVRQLRDAMRESVEELRALTISEVGAPRMLTAAAQLEGPVDDLAFAADTAESYCWEQDLGRAAPMGIPTRRTLAREAVGVVGAITPWNFPHQINLAKLGPALAAGNAVVLKPAPDTPWCAAVLGELIANHTDFPPGVVNIVTSSDHGLGALLAKDPRVDMVSFTGSTATGRSVMADAAATVKRVFLELGGKSAFVVLDDADLTGACSVSAFTAAVHAGQGCAITTRLVVPRARYDEAVAIAARTMSSIRPGDPNDPGTVCGPLISARQRDRVQSYLDLAIAEGGTFACGGGRPADKDVGYFIEPTVIAGLTNEARPAREEIFGPVLTVIAHDGDDDAVRIANDSPYGLSGTVYSADPSGPPGSPRGCGSAP